MNTDKRKALVTGGSRGIGFGIAGELAKRGCRVVITGRSEDTLVKASQKMENSVIPLVWDLKKTETIGEMVEKAAELADGLDIVVNNAGIFAKRDEWNREELLKTTVSEWKEVMDVNCSSFFFTMQASVNYMLKHNIKGNILNISSVAAYEPVYGAYGASKTVCASLTRGWGRMLAESGITVNGIAPGPVATQMNNWHEGDSLKHERVPYGRFLTVEEISKLAVYLLSEDAKILCGETVTADGGYSIR